jgi:hypothetical protein
MKNTNTNYIKISTFNDDDAADMFKEICETVLKSSIRDQKEVLGLPGVPVTISDLIALIRHHDLRFEFAVLYTVKKESLAPKEEHEPFPSALVNPPVKKGFDIDDIDDDTLPF